MLKKIFNLKLTILLVIILFAIIALILIKLNSANSEDPNWDETHFTTSNISDIEKICKDDFLLKRILTNAKVEKEFILEIQNGANFFDPQHWVSLSAIINYGKSPFDSNSDNITCFISFNRNPVGTYIDEILIEASNQKYKCFNVEQTEINGTLINIAYLDNRNDYNTEFKYGSKKKYIAFAEFDYKGYVYYITTESDNLDFFDSVLNSLLK